MFLNCKALPLLPPTRWAGHRGSKSITTYKLELGGWALRGQLWKWKVSECPPVHGKPALILLLPDPETKRLCVKTTPRVTFTELYPFVFIHWLDHFPQTCQCFLLFVHFIIVTKNEMPKYASNKGLHQSSWHLMKPLSDTMVTPLQTALSTPTESTFSTMESRLSKNQQNKRDYSKTLL